MNLHRLDTLPLLLPDLVAGRQAHDWTAHLGAGARKVAA